MPISTKTKGISLDAVGTLIELCEPVGVTYARFGREAGLSLSEKSLALGFREASRSCGIDPPREIGGEKCWWRRLVRLTFENAGAGSEALSVAFEALFERLFAHYAGGKAWQLYPESKSVLAALSVRYPIIVLSNFDERLLAVLGDLGIDRFFHEVIVSDRIGCRKPEPRMFVAAARSLNLETHELLHVGDDPDCDWRGAQAAGCAVFRLKRPGNSLSDLL